MKFLSNLSITSGTEGINMTNGSILVNSYNTSLPLFYYNNGTTQSFFITNTGSLFIENRRNFSEFIVNDISSNTGTILKSNNGNLYWETPGATQVAYVDNYTEYTGLSNTRCYSAQFSFLSNNFSSLSYSVSFGYPATNSFGVTSGLTTSFLSSFVNVDIYHNLNNQYPIVSFYGFSSSTWNYIYPEIGLSGFYGTFSFITFTNHIRISLTGSLLTLPMQVNIVG
jgi:archaellin